MSSGDQPTIFLPVDRHGHHDHRSRSPSPLVGGMNNLNINNSLHRKRASSFKKPKEKNIDSFLLEEMRPRTSSMPTRNTYLKPYLRTHMGLNIEPDGETYTVRSFKMNSKGVIVNRGDSMRSRSTNSVFSSEGELCQLSPSSRTSSSISRDSVAGTPGPIVSVSDTTEPAKVLVVGPPGVGKSALTQQFMTSEYLGGFDTSIDGDRARSVNVLLNGEETALSFIASPDLELDISFDDVTGYVLVYACDDKQSFQQAVDTLFFLRKNQQSDDAIILVGNKSDLVRSRCVPTEEAKSVAQTYDCKFIETSVVLNVNVDELLVGIVRQIRLKQKEDNSACQGCGSTGKHMLNKLFKNKASISKSCENLYK